MLVGSEIAKVQEKLSAKVTFNRPFDRGYVTNWEVQDRVWKQVFKELHVSASPRGRRGRGQVTGSERRAVNAASDAQSCWRTSIF